MNFKTIFWEDNGWVMAKVLGYPGAVAQSKTIEEAKEVLEDAMLEFIKVRIENGKDIIENFGFKQTKEIINKYSEKDIILSFITVNLKKADNDFYKTVRTNLTVISGYKKRAKKDKLNLSKFLNDALEIKYG